MKCSALSKWKLSWEAKHKIPFLLDASSAAAVVTWAAHKDSFCPAHMVSTHLRLAVAM